MENDKLYLDAIRGVILDDDFAFNNLPHNLFYLRERMLVFDSNFFFFYTEEGKKFRHDVKKLKALYLILSCDAKAMKYYEDFEPKPKSLIEFNKYREKFLLANHEVLFKNKPLHFLSNEHMFDFVHETAIKDKDFKYEMVRLDILSEDCCVPKSQMDNKKELNQRNKLFSVIEELSKEL